MKFRELKKRIVFLEKENEHLLDLVEILTKTISNRDDEIRELLETVKRFEKSSSRVKHENFRVPFTKESEHSLLCEEHKEVVGAPTNFPSRFMPNVKFIYPDEIQSHMLHSFFHKEAYDYALHTYFITGIEGETLYAKTCDIWDEFPKKEVSIYWAIPELVPKGMYYDKDLDKLIVVPPLKNISAAIKSFAGELSRATPYSITTCLSVIEDYGEQNARAVLDLMASGFKLKKD